MTINASRSGFHDFFICFELWSNFIFFYNVEFPSTYCNILRLEGLYLSPKQQKELNLTSLYVWFNKEGRGKNPTTLGLLNPTKKVILVAGCHPKPHQLPEMQCQQCGKVSNKCSFSQDLPGKEGTNSIRGASVGFLASLLEDANGCRF